MRDGGGEDIRIEGGGFTAVTARTAWGAAGSGVEDEATAQAVTGMMAVHGRRHGSPRGLGVDHLAAATGVLAVQGLLAGLIGQARGGPVGHVRTTADRAGLLAVSQYLAAAGADEPEAVETITGGPPFTSSDGVLFELETLDRGAWAAFWRALEAPADAVRAGWRPFQFRYATACAPSRRSCTGRPGDRPARRRDVRTAAAEASDSPSIGRTAQRPDTL